MTFADPSLLPWLWGLLIIPVLYLMRRPAKPVGVPHLFLWERVVKTRLPRKRRRLRNLLGMLFQILIAASLLLAWAGPQKEQQQKVPRPSLVIVDSSLSMATVDQQKVSRLERAKKLINQGLPARLKKGPCSLVAAAASTSTLQPLTDDAQALGESLANWPAPEGELGTDRLVRFVREARESEPDLEMTLLTDLCFDSSVADSLTELGCRVEAIRDQGMNVGFVEFSVTPMTLGIRVETTVAAFGRGSLSGTVSLRSAQETLASKTLTLSQGADAELGFDVELKDEEWLQLVWEAGEDSFEADNVLEFKVPTRDLLDVLVVAPKVNRYLRGALEALDDQLDLSTAAVTTPDKWRQAKGYDLTILVGVEERRRLPKGAFILVNSWAPELPMERGALIDEVEVVRQNKGPVLLRGLDLRNLAVKKARQVRAASSLEVLLEGTSGPLISRGVSRQSRFVHLAFDIDEKNSSLVLLPAFPLLLKDASNYLVPRKERRLAAAHCILDVLPGSLSSRGAGDLVVEYLTADGEGELQTLQSDKNDGLIRLGSRPGRIRLYVGEESETCGLNVCNRRFSSVYATSTVGVEVPERAQDKAKKQESLARYFYLFALVILLLEWLCFTRGWTR